MHCRAYWRQCEAVTSVLTFGVSSALRYSRMVVSHKLQRVASDGSSLPTRTLGCRTGRKTPNGTVPFGVMAGACER